MAYLRFSPSAPGGGANDNWTRSTRDSGRNTGRNSGHAPETWGQRRYAPTPPRRRRGGGHLLLGLIAIPMGVWGLWLLLGTPAPPERPEGPPIARPLVFQVPPPGLSIVVSHEPPPSNHPETWGALPTAVGGPVVATPLADPSPPVVDAARCRDVPTLAAQMTCIDPVLRDAERRMSAAYDAVLTAGVSPPALGRSQARWLAARDAAAVSSPEDLLAAYQAREGQLRGFAAALEHRAASVGMRDATSPPPVTEAIAQRSVGGVF